MSSKADIANRSWTPPIAPWLANYQREWLPSDVVAGVTLAAYAIPVSLAYATLAGVPPHFGIYCYLVGGLAYALFGTSRQLAIGPTSAIAMLVGATVAGMAVVDKDIPDGLMVSGFPARDHREELRERALARRLPKLVEQLKNLIHRVEKLEASTHHHP